jgi:hypothetical protein
MRFRCVLMASTWLLATAAMAQTSPAASGQSDSWATHPATASSTTFRGHAAVDAAPTHSPFKFRERQRTGPADQPPPSATDKAAVMGTDRAWQNGRPPVNCAQTPMDATCRH